MLVNIKDKHRRGISVYHILQKPSRSFKTREIGKNLLKNVYQLIIRRPATLLKRNSSTDVFLQMLQIFKNTYSTEHYRTTAFDLVGWRDNDFLMIAIVME